MRQENKLNHSRRQFLAAGVAGVTTLALPTRNIASSLNPLAILSPARVFGGILFDTFHAATLQPVEDSVVDLIVDGKKFTQFKHQLSTCLGYCGSEVLQPDNYKGALIVLGVTDYQQYKERERQQQLAILLKDDPQLRRFEAALKYLVDEHIEVELVNGLGIAEVLPANTKPDTLLNIRKMPLARKEQLRLYAALVDKTGTTAFDQWVA